MKIIKAKCIKCGEVEITHFEDGDGAMCIPVALCPTLEDVNEYCKQFSGEDYEKATGNKIEKSFEKVISPFSHESPDEVGHDEAMKHIIDPIWVWAEII